MTIAIRRATVDAGEGAAIAGDVEDGVKAEAAALAVGQAEAALAGAGAAPAARVGCLGRPDWFRAAQVLGGSRQAELELEGATVRRAKLPRRAAPGDAAAVG